MWVDNDLTKFSGGTLSSIGGVEGSNPPALDAYTEEDGSQHVNFMAGGHVHELYRSPDPAAQWADNDLSDLAHEDAFDNVGPIDGYSTGDGSQHVNVIDGDRARARAVPEPGSGGPVGGQRPDRVRPGNPGRPHQYDRWVLGGRRQPARQFHCERARARAVPEPGSGGPVGGQRPDQVRPAEALPAIQCPRWVLAGRRQPARQLHRRGQARARAVPEPGSGGPVGGQRPDRARPGTPAALGVALDGYTARGRQPARQLHRRGRARARAVPEPGSGGPVGGQRPDRARPAEPRRRSCRRRRPLDGYSQADGSQHVNFIDGTGTCTSCTGARIRRPSGRTTT